MRGFYRRLTSNPWGVCVINQPTNQQKEIASTRRDAPAVIVPGFLGHPTSLPLCAQGASTRAPSSFPAHLNHSAETSFPANLQTDPGEPSDKHRASPRQQVARQGKGQLSLFLSVTAASADLHLALKMTSYMPPNFRFQGEAGRAGGDMDSVREGDFHHKITAAIF